jgi:hypothetical protein
VIPSVIQETSVLMSLIIKLILTVTEKVTRVTVETSWSLEMKNVIRVVWTP